MRISDWSSDVCSSDLAFERGDRGVLVLDHAGDGAERTVGDVPRDRAPELPRRDAPRLAIGTGRDDRHIGVAEGGVEVIAEGVELTDHLRSEEHTSELQSLMRISYAVFCLKKKTNSYTQKKVTHR